MRPTSNLRANLHYTALRIKFQTKPNPEIGPICMSFDLRIKASLISFGLWDKLKHRPCQIGPLPKSLEPGPTHECRLVQIRLILFIVACDEGRGRLRAILFHDRRAAKAARKLWCVVPRQSGISRLFR